jgi:hypothetical protein
VIPLAKAGNILRLLCRNSASAPCLLPAKYWELMMIRPTLCIAALALACLPVQSQQVNSEAGAMIEARRGLMSQLDSIQTMIDERLTEPEYSYELYDLAHAAASSLDAFALLFPPETRPLDGAAIDGIETTAAAQIWDDLPAFRKLVRDTVRGHDGRGIPGGMGQSGQDLHLLPRDLCLLRSLCRPELSLRSKSA